MHSSIHRSLLFAPASMSHHAHGSEECGKRWRDLPALAQFAEFRSYQ
jgi:hypothetical protein